MAFRNALGWLVVSGIGRQVRGVSMVNRKIAMDAESEFDRLWPVAYKNGELADDAYEQCLKCGSGNQRKRAK